MTVGVFREFFYNERLDFKELNRDTIVILDTNTLLNIYRYSNETRAKLITAIKSIQNNIWMPYQVGLEFNLNRRNVISNLNREKETRKSEIEKVINDSVIPLQQSVRAVSLKSTDANLQKKEIIEFIEEKTTNLKNELQRQIDELFEMVDISEDLASEIATIFDGHIGECYTQEQLNEKLKDAKERFENKLPPGYKDANKVEITNYNGIRFERKYGDLIVWHQILDKASDENIKKVVIITDDNKEDWWFKSGGKTIGPRAELKNEMLRIANADLYMLNANSFLNNLVSEEDTKDLISTENNMEETDEEKLIWLDLPQIRGDSEELSEVEKVRDKRDIRYKSFKHSLSDSEMSSTYTRKEKIMHELGSINSDIKLLQGKIPYKNIEIDSLSSKINSMVEDTQEKRKLAEYVQNLIVSKVDLESQIDNLQIRRNELFRELLKLAESEIYTAY
ncbi:PIN-like domain-containing protein [Lysinibacillus sp. Bpr_S20]|uniref:PIN-like domain-containing protein n=1 Tax=Lysinibacillus sp. Bpr_S20 TaxID=2933964 RepID=UPI0020133B54|nr:PIN-like domain-containing protein [Lysinibacillus sp. Bpr_S20]MCL1701611.1 PIN-like domain-containing protein [Lysinibacillus sp. Bpr_S20]